MKTIILLCGLYSIAFAIFHIFFWKIFNWKIELKKLNFANRAIIQILNTRIIYLFFFIAFICFFYPDELLTTRLGNIFLAGISLFWLGRAIEQFVFLKVNNFIFIIGAILFVLPLIL